MKYFSFALIICLNSYSTITYANSHCLNQVAADTSDVNSLPHRATISAAKAREELLALLKSGSPYEREFVIDILTTRYIQSFTQNESLSSIALLGLPNDSSIVEMSSYRNLLESSNKAHAFTIRPTKTTSSQAPLKFGVELGATESSSCRECAVPQLSIVNPYLRMQALGESQHTIMLSDSAAAIGLLINQKLKYTMPILANRSYSKALFATKSLNPENGQPNLGLSFKSSPVVYRNQKLRDNKTIKSVRPLILSNEIGTLSDSEALELLAAAKRFQVMNDQVDQMANGAVIFGSNKIPGDYTQTIYQLARRLAQLGVRVTTGGAGGVMEIANQGAFDAGGTSLGVAIGGGAVDNERVVKSDVQSHTFVVSDYPERIALLLKKNPLIIMAPGGKGTMKELATALVEEEFNDMKRQYVFLGSAYYGSIVKFLKQSLPHLADRIHLIDSPSDIDAIVIKASMDWGDIASNPNPKPRNSRTSYSTNDSPTPSEPSKKAPWYKFW